MKARRIVAASSAAAIAAAIVVSGTTSASADVTQTASCVDGGGIRWNSKAVWGASYRGADGVQRVSMDYAGWTTTKAGTVPTYSAVKMYDAAGKATGSQSWTGSFDYRSGSAYQMRNPTNPPDGKSRVSITLGVAGDGFGNCTVSFVQPTTTSSTDISVTAGNVTTNAVTVTWSERAGATGYLVGRNGVDSTGGGAWSTTDPANTRSRTFDKLVAGQTYIFSVTPMPAGVAKTVTVKVLATNTPTPPPTTPPTTPPPTKPPTTPPTTPPPTTPPTTPGDTTPGWLSGTASHPNAYGTWRGAPTEIVATWINDPALFTLTGPGSLESFNGAIDIAVNPPSFPGWAATANGASDTFFRDVFRNLKAKRAGKGPVYMRPWHEYNGGWMAASVTNDAQAADFKRSFDRIAAIGRAEFPAMKISIGTAAAGPYAVAKTLPKASSFDVVSIDFYNNWPFCTSTACFNDKIENGGGVNSLADLQRVAAGAGKPVLISEWSNQGDTSSPTSNGGGGESPQFIRDWHAWVKANAGTGPGKVLGEVQFDLWQNSFAFTDDQGHTASVQPKTSEEYRRLW